MRMLSCRGIQRQAAHFLLHVLLSVPRFGLPFLRWLPYRGTESLSLGWVYLCCMEWQVHMCTIIKSHNICIAISDDISVKDLEVYK